ncbi:BnaA03g58010D [Brassica napus]|uniref:BnaA03g58010D protein n=1 Tax=Brassica napus TaxID=3708 RepID=A0A078IZX8_BRANA|nr:BnaA03g58010D [Brassica napus]
MNQTRRKRRSDPPLSRPDSLSPEMPFPSKSPSLLSPRVRNIFLLLTFCSIVFTLFTYCTFRRDQISSIARSLPLFSTQRRHLLFSIAASRDSWLRRSSYVRLWYSPNSSTRAVVFLDRRRLDPDPDHTLPPVIVSQDVSRFPYTFPGGLRSAIRVARVVKETIDRGDDNKDVRWFVFGDDDTVFFVDNLVTVLSKYDHRKWWYVGSNSEFYDQNVRYSFDMAFGGGGFAISASLGKVLARVLDSCLMRYAHLYGSDSRIFSCLAELGVALTHEPGFHQIDVRGNLFGLLCAHPLAPLVSLHHLDAVDPFFPKTNRTESVARLISAASFDSARILQQSVCYDSSNIVTVSVVWGYAIQVYEGNKLLPDLLTLQKTFSTWRRGSGVRSNYMFSTRDYKLHNVGNCHRAEALKRLQRIRVLSRKLKLNVEQMNPPRRQCCDISSPFNTSMVINIRQCMPDELIAMNT